MNASPRVLLPVFLMARAGAATLLVGALCFSAPVHASPDAVAGTLFGAGAGALIGQAVGGQQGAVVGGIVGAVAGHAISSSDAHPRAYGGHSHSRPGVAVWSTSPPPPPVVGWGVHPPVVYPPHAVVIAPRPVYAPVPVTVVVPAPPVHYWERSYDDRPRHHRHHRHHDRHHRHHWD